MRTRLLRYLAALAAALAAGCGEPEPPAPMVRASSTFVPAPGANVPAAPPAGAPAALAVIERLGVSVRAGPNGLVIIALDLDGPAAQAGTRVGDVVVGVNGSAAADAAELQKLVKAAEDGMRLQLRRSGAAHQVAIHLPEPKAEAAWTPFGLQVRELPDSARKALGVTHGVMVTKIRAPADQTRILPGDVIVAVDRHKVQNVEEFGRLAERAAERRGAAVGLHVKRADSDLFIPLEPAEIRAGAGAPGEASRGGGRPDERYRKRSPAGATGTPLRT